MPRPVGWLFLRVTGVCFASRVRYPFIKRWPDPDLARALGARDYDATRIASDKVVSGGVVVDSEPLTERLTVTVLAPDDDETFDLMLEKESWPSPPSARQNGAGLSTLRSSSETVVAANSSPYRVVFTECAVFESTRCGRLVGRRSSICGRGDPGIARSRGCSSCFSGAGRCARPEPTPAERPSGPALGGAVLRVRRVLEQEAFVGILAFWHGCRDSSRRVSGLAKALHQTRRRIPGAVASGGKRRPRFALVSGGSRRGMQG